MTIEKFDEKFWEFFVMQESFKKTNFNSKKT
jgi:riboflavin synthase alpha subunit